MSDLVGKLNYDANLGANRPVEPFQSVRVEATNVGNGHSLHIESQEQHYTANKHRSIFRLENDASGSESSGFAEVTEARTVRIMKKDVVASSETLIHERFGRRQQHTIFNLSQNFKSSSDGKSTLNLSSFRQLAKPPIDCNSEYAAPLTTETLSNVSHRFPQHYENNTQVILHDSLALGGPSRDKFTAPNQMANRMNMEKLPALSSVRKRKMHTQLARGVESKEDVPSSSFTLLGHEHHSYHSSTFLVSREKDREYGKYHSIGGVGEQYQKIHGFSDNETSPNQRNHPEPIIAEKLHGKSLLCEKMPQYVHDMEAMRSYKLNSLDKSAGGTASFPQRTSKFLLMDATDFNSSKKSRAFWELTVPAKVKGKTSAELLSCPASGMGQIVEFHPPDIVAKDEDNVKSPEIPSKNESSADTDTMDIGDLKEQTDLSGINSSSSHNVSVLQMTPGPPSEVKLAPVGDGTKCRRAINTLPDINEEIPVSTSRTLSLDVEHLISPPQEMKPNSNNSSITPVEETDPSSRWLKRLRLGTSNSFGLNLNVEETSSHKNGGNLSSTLVKGKNMCSSENRDTLLSESWIKRWCCNEANSVKQPRAVRSCEPRSSKKESDKLENKAFPSFAAMALVGRAMSGFRPCEFQSRGSFVVWNTNDV